MQWERRRESFVLGVYVSRGGAAEKASGSFPVSHWEWREQIIRPAVWLPGSHLPLSVCLSTCLQNSPSNLSVCMSICPSVSVQPAPLMSLLAACPPVCMSVLACSVSSTCFHKHVSGCLSFCIACQSFHLEHQIHSPTMPRRDVDFVFVTAGRCSCWCTES